MKLILIFLMTLFLMFNRSLGLFEAQGFRRSWFLGGILNKTLVGKFNLLSDFADRNTVGYKHSHYEDNWDYYHYLQFDKTCFDFSIFMLLFFTFFAIVFGLMTYAAGLVLTITGHLDSDTKDMIDAGLWLLGIMSLPWLGLDLYVITRTFHYFKVRHLKDLSLQIEYAVVIYKKIIIYLSCQCLLLAGIKDMTMFGIIVVYIIVPVTARISLTAMSRPAN